VSELEPLADGVAELTNYVDPDATRPITLGPCRCPGTPHEADTADVVVRFGYGEKAKIRQVGRMGGIEQLKLMAVLLGVKRWNLVLPNGSARPIDAEQIARLDEDTIDALFDTGGALDDAFAVRADLPKASSGPSPSGSPGSGGSTRKTRTPPPSTTS
jgi:hypothetical protein